MSKQFSKYCKTDHCKIEILKLLQGFWPNYTKIMSKCYLKLNYKYRNIVSEMGN